MRNYCGNVQLYIPPELSRKVRRIIKSYTMLLRAVRKRLVFQIAKDQNWSS